MNVNSNSQSLCSEITNTSTWSNPQPKCKFCYANSHTIATCDSDELHALIINYVHHSMYSLKHLELPTRESSRFIQWLFQLSHRQLNALVSRFLRADHIPNELHTVCIGRLALNHSNLFSYDLCNTIYSHPLIDRPDMNINQSLVENIWIRMIESFDTYYNSAHTSLAEGNMHYLQFLSEIDYTGENESILFDFAEMLLYDPNHEKDKNAAASYVCFYAGYGITDRDIYTLFPNIDEYKENLLMGIEDDYHDDESESPETHVFDDDDAEPTEYDETFTTWSIPNNHWSNLFNTK